MGVLRLFGTALILVVLTACANDAEQVAESTEIKGSKHQQICQSSDDINVFCGFGNPEDLVVTPDGEQLLVSEMGTFMVHEPSGMALFELETGQRAEIGVDWQQPATWGDNTCSRPNPDLFSPHGIDLLEREDGSHQLLVVNHGGRESVEFFELARNDAEQWHLTWRGCALPPGDPFINDVAALNDGGFVVTHMWDKGMPFENVAEKLLAGEKIGWAYEWQPATGFTQIPGSIEMMPNGVTVNADNSKIFLNIYMGNKTVRIDRETGEQDGEFAVQQPDNITIDDTGTLWVASHRHDPINQTCTEPGVCLLPFAVVKADSTTLKAEVVLAHEGAPMGYSTVALRVGDKVYMGSAHGDRIASFSLKN